MLNAMHRSVTFALYQFTLALGILLMPIALLARRAGLRLPIDRAVEATGAAYERADGNARTN